MHALVCWPYPAFPINFTTEEYVSIIGFALSKAFCSPPHIETRVPFLAPTSPPETGASTEPTPFSLAIYSISYAKDGEDVVWSTITEPGFIYFRI